MILPAVRTENFEYPIRDLVAVAEGLEKEGQKVIHLNIGDPQVFGFRPPENVIKAVGCALREKFTGYSHSAGLISARKAVAKYASSLGAETNPDDVILTSGASEGAELILTASLNQGDEVLLPSQGVTYLTFQSSHYRIRSKFSAPFVTRRGPEGVSSSFLAATNRSLKF